MTLGRCPSSIFCARGTPASLSTHIMIMSKQVRGHLEHFIPEGLAAALVLLPPAPSHSPSLESITQVMHLSKQVRGLPSYTQVYLVTYDSESVIYDSESMIYDSVYHLEHFVPEGLATALILLPPACDRRHVVARRRAHRPASEMRT